MRPNAGACQKNKKRPHMPKNLHSYSTYIVSRFSDLTDTGVPTRRKGHDKHENLTLCRSHHKKSYCFVESLL